MYISCLFFYLVTFKATEIRDYHDVPGFYIYSTTHSTYHTPLKCINIKIWRSPVINDQDRKFWNCKVYQQPELQQSWLQVFSVYNSNYFDLYTRLS